MMLKSEINLFFYFNFYMFIDFGLVLVGYILIFGLIGLGKIVFMLMILNVMG